MKKIIGERNKQERIWSLAHLLLNYTLLKMISEVRIEIGWVSGLKSK